MKKRFAKFCHYIAIAFILTEILHVVSASPNLQNGATFDFIIVGAGTAGCAVASRLAESGEHTVLLISEGGLPHPDFEVPALATNMTLMSDPDYVKTYQTVPQRNAGLAQNGRISLLVGRLLGGGSGINGMWLNRGNPQDYNHWADLTGDDSWTYANLLKYFRKYEAYTGNNPTDQHGFKGPITVSPPGYAPGLVQWLQGGIELGYPMGDSNGPQTESFALLEFSQKRGRRVSSYKGYIEPLLWRRSSNNNELLRSSRSSRSNLLIFTHTLANRIMFKGNQAVGVKFTSQSSGNQIVGYAKARKEIIVSAGALDSPALLMKSGIGRKATLEQANIPIVRDLPVGRNLQDHARLPLTLVFGNRSMVFDAEQELTAEAWRIYEETGDGPYSSYIGASGQAFVTSSVLSPLEKYLRWPDLHLGYLNAAGRNFFVASIAEVTDLQEGEVTATWLSMLGRPKSRGSVTLDRRNIDNPPLIDLKYLTHSNDMDAIIEGLKIMIKLCEDTTALQRVRCRLPAISVPACDHLEYHSDPFWKCYARQFTGTTLHAAGTCKMGNGLNDPDAVVDTKLRVIGMEGLRVVDASIMPTITNANTQGAVYVIAEKAADMILKSWGDSSLSRAKNIDDEEEDENVHTFTEHSFIELLG